MNSQFSKRCKRCGLEKPVEDFDTGRSLVRHNDRVLRALCGSCHRDVKRGQRQGLATRKGGH